MSDTSEITNGCLTHYDSSHIQTRRDFMGLCPIDEARFEDKPKEKPNQECMAKITRIMETLTNQAKAQWKLEALKLKEKGLDIPSEPKEYPIELANSAVVSLIYETFGESMVRNCLDYLVELGYLKRWQEKKNTIPIYWFQFAYVQALLEQQAKAHLAGCDFKPPHMRDVLSNPKPVKSHHKRKKSNPNPPISQGAGFESTDNNNGYSGESSSRSNQEGGDANASAPAQKLKKAITDPKLRAFVQDAITAQNVTDVTYSQSATPSQQGEDNGYQHHATNTAPSGDLLRAPGTGDVYSHGSIGNLSAQEQVINDGSANLHADLLPLSSELAVMHARDMGMGEPVIPDWEEVDEDPEWTRPRLPSVKLPIVQGATNGHLSQPARADVDSDGAGSDSVALGQADTVVQQTSSTVPPLADTGATSALGSPSGSGSLRGTNIPSQHETAAVPPSSVQSPATPVPTGATSPGSSGTASGGKPKTSKRKITQAVPDDAAPVPVPKCDTREIQKRINANRGYGLEEAVELIRERKAVKSWCNLHTLNEFEQVMTYLTTKDKYWKKPENKCRIGGLTLMKETPRVLAELRGAVAGNSTGELEPYSFAWIEQQRSLAQGV